MTTDSGAKALYDVSSSDTKEILRIHTERQGSLPRSEQLATCPYLWPAEWNPRPAITYPYPYHKVQ
jgi:hypothetical protein